MFAADGTLLFTSSRPDVEDEAEDPDAPAALWALPAGGEARRVASRAGGLSGVVAARSAPVVVALSDTLPASVDGEDDAARRARRTERKVQAVLHAGYPVRHWDADLGPGENRVVAGELPEPAWRDLTPAPGRALDGAVLDLSADGSTAVATWTVREPHGSAPHGARRRRRRDRRAAHARRRRHERRRGAAAVAGRAARSRSRRSAAAPPPSPVDRRLMVVPVDGSAEPRDVAPGWDLWGGDAQWTPDGNALLVLADEQGARPVFRVERRHRRGGAADRRPRALLRPAGLAGRRLRCTPCATRSTRRRRRCASTPAPPTRSRCACPGPRPRPPLPGTLDRGHDDGGGRHPPARLARAARGRGPAPAAAVGARRPARVLERLVLALVPLADGRPRLRRAAARPRHCRPATGSTWSGAGGATGAGRRTPTCSRSPTPRSSATTSTPTAPRRWAARTAATSSTGSPATPTGSARSSRTPACGT